MAILVIHGGAGGDGPWLGKTPLDPGRIYCMKQVLSVVGTKLSSGEIDCLEAVTLAVEMLEDEPLFNAGQGSVIGEDGSITMDASIMRGADRAAGSVINVTKLRHPIRAANLILHQGWPVILNSAAADDFGVNGGVEEVSQDWLKQNYDKANGSNGSRIRQVRVQLMKMILYSTMIWREELQRSFLMKEWALLAQWRLT